MAIKYTVREISTSSITVDYSDGSWAIVPIHSAMSKQEIEDRIGDFNPISSQFISVEDIPFNVGDSGESTSLSERKLIEKIEQKEKNEAEQNRILTYEDFRLLNYPLLGDQLDALYWARQGNDTFLKEIDKTIQSVKDQFPKDMEPITQSEYDAIIEGVVNNVLD